MRRALVVAAGLLLTACGGDDGPAYDSCPEARLAYAEAFCDSEDTFTAGTVVDTCDALDDLLAASADSPPLCEDGSNAFRRLVPVCRGGAAAACEECSHDFNCNFQQ